MFGLFGKDAKEKKEKAKAAARSKAIREEALANARAARENIGEDTLQKIAEHLSRKENSPFSQAKNRIQAMDKDHVADNLRVMLDEDRKKK